MENARIRYTDPWGKVTFLAAKSLKEARRLYRYAVKVATAPFLIELMLGDEVLDTHKVPDANVPPMSA